ncbi:hypothetical protein J6590_004751 [Homalodisca vitripennis]|nr:hypothetical protein J6590_004751 [Homalodisca vitripennis]
MVDSPLDFWNTLQADPILEGVVGGEERARCDLQGKVDGVHRSRCTECGLVGGGAARLTGLSMDNRARAFLLMNKCELSHSDWCYSVTSGFHQPAPALLTLPPRSIIVPAPGHGSVRWSTPRRAAAQTLSHTGCGRYASAYSKEWDIKEKEDSCSSSLSKHPGGCRCWKWHGLFVYGDEANQIVCGKHKNLEVGTESEKFNSARKPSKHFPIEMARVNSVGPDFPRVGPPLCASVRISPPGQRNCRTQRLPVLPAITSRYRPITFTMGGRIAMDTSVLVAFC